MRVCVEVPLADVGTCRSGSSDEPTGHAVSCIIWKRTRLGDRSPTCRGPVAARHWRVCMQSRFGYLFRPFSDQGNARRPCPFSPPMSRRPQRTTRRRRRITGPPISVALRAEIDRIDDGLHDLLMRRAGGGRAAGGSGAKNGVALRPGREAAILRRLLARHDGRCRRRWWCGSGGSCWPGRRRCRAASWWRCARPIRAPASSQAAREQFGALTPMRVHGSAAQAIADISAGRATVAVLPLPSETEAPPDAWWTALSAEG